MCRLSRGFDGGAVECVGAIGAGIFDVGAVDVFGI